MRLLDKMRRQYACHWTRTGTNDYGQPTFSAAAERRVRWEQTTELFVGRGGDSIASRAKVYTDSAVAFAEDDVLWLGELDDLPAACTSNPFAEQIGAYSVRKVDRIPTLKANQTLQVCWL